MSDGARKFFSGWMVFAAGTCGFFAIVFAIARMWPQFGLQLGLCIANIACYRSYAKDPHAR